MAPWSSLGVQRNVPVPFPWSVKLAPIVLSGSLEASVALLNYRNPREYWRNVVYSAPVPILYAVTPRFSEQAANLKRRKPEVWIEVFETAGHALLVDDAARFNALVDDFLFTKLPVAGATTR